MWAILVIFFRWMHVLAACAMVGGAFFIRVLVPTALKKLPEASRHATFLALRRTFKMLVHTSILLLLVSGVFNTIANLPAYSSIAMTAHSLLGSHILLGLVIFAISIYVLIGAEPPASHAAWMAVNVSLMCLTVLLGGILKFARDHRPSGATGATNPVMFFPGNGTDR